MVLETELLVYKAGLIFSQAGTKKLFAMAEMIGEVFQKSNNLQWEWRIPGFLSLPEEVGKSYRSSKFFFSGACWELRVFPNGQTKESEGWVSPYLWRTDTGPSLTVECSLGIRKANGAEQTLAKQCSHTFSGVGGRGPHKFLQRTDLVRRRAHLAPSDLLTVICTMKNDSRHSTEVSLCSRMWKTITMLRGILSSEEGADVTFKLEDGELRAHKLILKARSKVFSRMFDTDMRESSDGEVHVPEVDKDSFNVVLIYMYTGVPQGLSLKNMSKVFAIAHKYELGELERLCVEYMKGCLSPETVCDVIQLADLYQETDLKDCAREFVMKNGAEVVKTDEWKTLKRENSSIVSELLDSILVKTLPQIKL